MSDDAAWARETDIVVESVRFQRTVSAVVINAAIERHILAAEARGRKAVRVQQYQRCQCIFETLSEDHKPPTQECEYHARMRERLERAERNVTKSALASKATP